MNYRPKATSAFCIFPDWHPHLPPELQDIPEADWLMKSRAKNWAEYVKINGQRSPAYFRKSDILIWFKLRFGKVHPASVASLIAAGFEEPTKLKKTNKNKQVRHA